MSRTTVPALHGPSRRGFVTATGVGLLGLLAACGSGGSDDAEAEATGPLSGTVTMWSSFTQGPRAEWMQKMADAFHAENPEVTVNIELFSWGEFNTKWTTGLTAGQVPDISTALPNNVVEMINAEALIPLDDVIDSIGRDRFPEAALREGRLEDVSYSVPIYSHAQVMWYRKDLLEAHGLGVPQTWEELAHAAKTIGRSNDLYGLSVPLGTGDMMGARYLNFYVRSAGERLLKADGSANLTSAAALEGITYWVDLYKEVSPEGSLEYAVLDQATLFYQGKTAFDFNSGFHISGVEANSPDLLGSIAAAPLPRLKASDPVNYPAETSTIPMVVWQASEVRREAKAFLEFLYSTDEYIEFLRAVPGGMLPVLSDVAEDPAFLDNETISTFADSIKVIQDQVGVGSAIGMEEGPVVQAGVLTSQGLIEKMFHSVIIDGTDIEAAAKDCDDKLNAAFKAAGAQIG
ncbi:ABC transporter substrate-binding protein [Actinomyces respiraculi]|uniref:ABC transporter substrate-binding protein n=1 Tax=Actinomyces respiraculi TaxID=2744574 RepID=UPI0014208410|nr:sugar ABC transporter substrate-binding protein [Actinomyces respiraculi]